MDAPIQVIKNFISPAQAKYLVDYIDFLKHRDPKEFNVYPDGKRFAFQFGQDMQYGSVPGYKTYLSLEKLAEVEQKELLREICTKVVSSIMRAYGDPQQLYVSSFWLAKQYPGCVIPPHEDTDGGYNSHFVYSAVLYLNTLTSGGELSFVDLDYSYKPEVGDLVVFPTVGTGAHGVLEIPEQRYSLPFWLTYQEDLGVEGLT